MINDCNITLHIYVCSAICDSVFFFMQRNHEKYHWAYLVEKNKFFNHEQGTDTIPWELCGSIIIPELSYQKWTAKVLFRFGKYFIEWRWESRGGSACKDSKQLLSPTCQPPLLALPQSPNSTLLSCYVLPPPEKNSGKPVAADWGRHFGFAIMNHFLSMNDVHIWSIIGKKTFQI